MAEDRNLNKPASASASHLADKATDQVHDISKQVEEIAGKVADQGREVSEQVQAVAGTIKDAVDKSVKDQPMATLAIAAVMGFVLGAIWKS